MGHFADMETSIDLANKYPIYQAHKEECRKRGRADSFDQIRYALAISHCMKEHEAESFYMFNGSLGVLGNLVNVHGLEMIPQFRPIHDVDLVLDIRCHDSTISATFDNILDYSKSITIKNKSTIRGESYDVDDQLVRPVNVDVNIVDLHGHSIGLVTGTQLHNGHLEERIGAKFYGLDVYCMPALPLLEMKLAVSCSDGGLRDKDCVDVRNLLGVLEKTGQDPQKIRNWLPPSRLAKLRETLERPLNLKDQIFILSDSSKKYKGVLKQ